MSKLGTDYTQEVNWLINQGVNIINCSWGSECDGKYNSTAAYFDHIAKNNYKTIVASAGNSGEFTNSLAMGYNIISVGSTNTNRGLSSFSAWKENISISKPNLTAVGEGFLVPSVANPNGYLGTWSGTSFSTPMVTGALAALMQNSGVMRVLPEMSMALITSSAKSNSSYSTLENSGFNDKVGAGCLDLGNARDAQSRTFSVEVPPSQAANSIVKTQQIYMSGTIKVSMALLIRGNKSLTPTFTNYNIRLKNSSGIVLKTVASSYNNVELLEYNLPSYGSYTIEIYMTGAKVNAFTDYLSYSISSR